MSIKKIAFFLLVFSAFTLSAQEKLLYSTNFTDWEAFSSTTEVSVVKKTDFSKEDLGFRFYEVTIDPAGRNESRFDYTLVSDGWAQAQKITGSYIITSPLKSITKVEFIHGATGSNRGYKLWKKNATDADWVLLSDAVANPAKGIKVVVDVNDTDVALRFTNINDTQNAYMFDLAIYGNYVSTNPQFPLDVTVSPEGAGTVVKNPDSELYDQGTEVSLKADKNFGFKFLHWQDATTGEMISSQNPLSITVDTALQLTAVFEAIETYAFDLKIEGSEWGQVRLQPEPVNGRYEAGEEVNASVVPNEVTQFSYWEDQSTTSERIIQIQSDMAITANFDEIPFIVGWDFRDQAVRSSRQGDYFTTTDNKGLISVYEPEGTPVNWLASTGFNPILPHVRLWTAGTEFKTRRRYLKAQFSTKGYSNISVKSLTTANFQAYSVIDLEYSLDDENYVKVASTDITEAALNGNWTPLPGILPEEAGDKDLIYLRWNADTASPIINEGNDNDGTAYTNVFVYADKIITVDTIKPELVSVIPTEGSATASITGNIVLTFNEKMKKGTGDILFNNQPIEGVYGSKTVTFKYGRLDYQTEYVLTVPEGGLTDLSGNTFEGLTLNFSTASRAEPIKKLFDAVVAQDGSGDYLTITEAIAAAPANRTTPWLVFVKNGKYIGHHDIPQNKPFLHIIGQNRDSVIISDNRLSGGDNAVHVSIGATMVVNATDIYFENLTIENSFGHEMQAGPQALALYATTDKFTMNKCYLRSYQDTYLTAYTSAFDRQYIRKSTIQGAVDFIYGGGDVFFDECQITVTRASGGYIVAPSHREGTLWGYVFSNCTIDQAVVPKATVYYGRAWQNKPKTVFLNTRLIADVYPVGWFYKMGAIPEIFADYGTMDANGNPVDLSQRISDYEYDVRDQSGTVIQTVKGTAKKSLTPEEAASYSYENVIFRNDNFWDPRLMTEAPEVPSGVKISGSKLTWEEVKYARLYLVFKDKMLIGFSASNEFVDSLTSGAGEYYVQSASEFGALSELSEAAEITTGFKQTKAQSILLFPNPVENQVRIKWPDAVNEMNFQIRDVQGRLVASGYLKSGDSNIDVEGLKSGIYFFLGKGQQKEYVATFVKN